MGPAVAIWMVIGVIYLVFLYVRHRQRVTDVAMIHLDEEPVVAPDPRSCFMSDLQVVTFQPEADQYAWTFGGVPPVARISRLSCSRSSPRTRSSAGYAARTTWSRRSASFPFVNPQTGPFYIEGAEPGDTLAVHFVSITPARDWGASTTIPLFGALTNTHLTALLNEPLPEIVWM